MDGSKHTTDNGKTNGNTQQSTKPKVSHQFRSLPAGIATCKISYRNTRRTHNHVAKNKGKSANSHQIDISKATKDAPGIPQAHIWPPMLKLGGTPGLTSRIPLHTLWSLYSKESKSSKVSKNTIKNDFLAPSKRAKIHSHGAPTVHHSVGGPSQVTIQSGQPVRGTTGSSYPGPNPIGTPPTKLEFLTQNELTLQNNPLGPPQSTTMHRAP